MLSPVKYSHLHVYKAWQLANKWMAVKNTINCVFMQDSDSHICDTGSSSRSGSMTYDLWPIIAVLIHMDVI